MKRQILLLFSIILCSLLSYSQTVNISVDKKTSCWWGFFTADLDIIGGTPTLIEWSDKGIWYTAGDTTFGVQYVTQGKHTIYARITFSNVVIDKQIDVFVGPIEFAINSPVPVGDNGCFIDLNPFASTFQSPLSSPFYNYEFVLKDTSGQIAYQYSASDFDYLLQGPLLPLGNIGSGIQPGPYFLSLTTYYDSTCKHTDSVSVLIPDRPNPSASYVDPQCGDDGEIDIFLPSWTGRSTNAEVSISGPNSFSRNYILALTDSLISLDSLASGSYVITVANRQLGCDSILDISLQAPISSQVNISAVVEDLDCDSMPLGSIDLNVTGFPTAPSYNWSTGDTTAGIDSLNAGSYSVTISDGICTFNRQYDVIDKQLSLSSSQTFANCNDSAATINLNVSGGQGPRTFSWSNGDSTQNLQGLSSGIYTVVVSDSSGCVNSTMATIIRNPLCPTNVTGRAFIDGNADCTYQVGEQLLRGSLTAQSNSNGQIFIVPLDTNGLYDISLANDSYTFTHSLLGNSNYSLVNCLPQSNHVLSLQGADTSGVDFPYQIQGNLRDLSVSLTAFPIRPGFNHTYEIDVVNAGTERVSSTLEFIHDSLASFISTTSGGVYDPMNMKVSWNVDDIFPGETRHFEVLASIPPSALINTPVEVVAFVDTAFGDSVPINNLFEQDILIVGSYDPNDKLVSEDVLLPNEQALTYTVRFQNTGNFPAEFVVIRDTLDSTVLNVSTLSPVSASHPYFWELDGSELIVSFPQIQLPDSMSDPEGSQGYIIFDIQAQPNLPLETIISNRAGIFFDFNAPIITNYAETRVALPLVMGRAYIDANGDCQYQSNEEIVSGQVVLKDLNQNERIIKLDSMGNYRLLEYPGSYFMTHSLAGVSGFDLASCLSGSQYQFELTKKDSLVFDFPFQLQAPGVNTYVSVAYSAIRPGEEHTYDVHITNLGDEAVSTSLNLTLDDKVDFVSASDNGNYQSGSSMVSWNVSSLLPGENRLYRVSASLPGSVGLGSLVDIRAFDGLASNDSLSPSNEFFTQAKIRAAEFSQTKLVDRDTLDPAANLLTYTIHFQNTGDSTLANLLVVDSLDDQNLDLSSIVLLGSSHPYSWGLSGRELKVNFPDIDLMPENVNKEASKGYFMFKVRIKDDLLAGTEITNEASIRMDNSNPVQTNQTNTILLTPVSVEDEFGKSIRIFPNPSTGLLYIRGLEGESARIEIYNSQGQALFKEELDSSGLDLSSLVKGVYFLKIASKRGFVVRKVYLE
ncbi:MAG: T9SS type A sorting domain-containing protein [Bacteroidia bacterium]|nr:T9SS type A sorting domain-containing protein [Bacteroidia bacterium]